ncbi:MAG: response regulator, partial [Ferruginibacter sp.]
LSLYEQQLYSLGYDRVSVFNNGYDCINNLSYQPDIILLDHGMENFNGFEVLKKIKEINPDIYVVFLSGQEDFSIIADTLNFGAYDFIVKSSEDIINIRSVFEKITSTKARIKMIKNINL